MSTPVQMRDRMLELRGLLLSEPASPDRAAWGMELDDLYERLGGAYGAAREPEPEADGRDREIKLKTAEIGVLNERIEAQSDALDGQSAEIVRLRDRIEAMNARSARRRWWQFGRDRD